MAVATLWAEGLAAQEDDAGVTVYRLRSSAQRASWLFSSPQRPWAPPFPDPEITWGLRRVIAQEQPQIVHGHDWLARSFLPLRRWSHGRFGSRFVTSLHYYTLTCAKKNLMRGNLPHSAPCSGPGLGKCLACAGAHYGRAKGTATVLANWQMAAAERSAADQVVSVSQATAMGNGLDATHTRQTVAPNFLPTPAPADEAALAPYMAQLPEGDFLLFVGDLRPMKGLDVLLAAYAKLVDAPPLVLIGKAWPDTPADLPPNTHVLKHWPNFAVMAAWRRSLIGVVPSVWAEPFGIVVIEAMAGGSPVVASRIGGIPEIVVDGETGFLVPPGNADALGAALARLLGDRELCARMGAAAQQRAGDYAAAAVVPQIEAIYQQLLREPPK